MSKKNTPAMPAPAPAPETASAPLDPAPTITPPSIPVAALDVGAPAVTVDPEAAEPVKVEDAARASATVNVTPTVSDEDIAEMIRESLSRDAPAPPDAPALKVLDLGAADRDAERLAAALERNARLDTTVSAIATHVMLSPETHTHLPDPDALSLLVELVRQTAEEARAYQTLTRVLSDVPAAALAVPQRRWCSYLQAHGWRRVGPSLQGDAERFERVGHSVVGSGSVIIDIPRDPAASDPITFPGARRARLLASLDTIARAHDTPVPLVVAAATGS